MMTRGQAAEVNGQKYYCAKPKSQPRNRPRRADTGGKEVTDKVGSWEDQKQIDLLSSELCYYNVIIVKAKSCNSDTDVKELQTNTTCVL